MKNCSPPLVSIIIPTFNAEKYIYATIQSCIMQSYKNIEIIIIDDSSNDNTLSIIKQFLDSRIIVFNLGYNIGAQNARNFGIQKAKGSLIQFLDHDDIIDIDKIYYQIKAYSIYGDDYIYSSNQGIINNNIKSLHKSYNIYHRDFTALEYFRLSSKQFGRYLTTGNWLLPRKILNKTHGWDVNSGINDDGEYFMRIILFSSGIKYSDRSFFYFRIDSENSLSKSCNNYEKYSKWFNSYLSYSSNFKLKFNYRDYAELSLNYFSKYYCFGFPLTSKLRLLCINEINKLGYARPLPMGSVKFKIISRIFGVNNSLKFRYILKNRINKKSVL
jgi:glycosyltransferase involved in cell wall biosynthesis